MRRFDTSKAVLAVGLAAALLAGVQSPGLMGQEVSPLRIASAVADSDGRSACVTRPIQVGRLRRGQAGFAIFSIDAASDRQLQVSVQGRPEWRGQRGRRFRIGLRAENAPTPEVEQQLVSGSASADRVRRQEDGLELVGKVGAFGLASYIIGISEETEAIPFDLRIDCDGDGELDRDHPRVIVTFGQWEYVLPIPSFTLRFEPGNLKPFDQVRVCLGEESRADESTLPVPICFEIGDPVPPVPNVSGGN